MFLAYTDANCLTRTSGCVLFRAAREQLSNFELTSNVSLAATCVLSADGWLLLPSYASRTLGIPRLARVFCPIADPRFTHSVK